MSASAKDLHAKTESSREHGAFVDALKYSEEAFVLYQSEKNILGLTDILASRSITLRHLWEKTQDTSFLILGKHECMAGVEIAQTLGDKSALVMPFLRLAQVQEELAEYSASCDSYSTAIETFKTNPPKTHDRPAVLMDMQIRFTICLYKSGDKTKLQEAIEALSSLEKSDEWQYNKDVWTSGGYMQLASILKEDNPEKSKLFLQKAKHIIDNNLELVLRKAQWEKLSNALS